MECAVCKQSVADFKLVMGASASSQDKINTPVEQPKASGESILGSFASTSDHSNIFDDGTVEDIDELHSAFEFGLDFGELRASTPKLEQQLEDRSVDGRSHHSVSQHSTRRDARKSEDNVVLRIDNVPWVNIDRPPT